MANPQLNPYKNYRYHLKLFTYHINLLSRTKLKLKNKLLDNSAQNLLESDTPKTAVFQLLIASAYSFNLNFTPAQN